MSIYVIRLVSERLESYDVRIGVVRRPPRGVPKAEFASKNCYATWLPCHSKVIFPLDVIVKMRPGAIGLF